MFCDPETAMLHEVQPSENHQSRDHKTYSLPEGPVNKCFICISSVKVNNSIN